jgi:hypothetical protein
MRQRADLGHAGVGPPVNEFGGLNGREGGARCATWCRCGATRGALWIAQRWP